MTAGHDRRVPLPSKLRAELDVRSSISTADCTLNVRKGPVSPKGCTKGYHSHEKPPEPEEASAKRKPCTEDLVLEPKSAEVLQRERPR